MIKSSIWVTYLCLTPLAIALSAQQPSLQDNIENPQSMWISLRYTTPDGIGYKTGYTTLEGFFIPSTSCSWFPFLDLRGHVFDNGKFAANAGLGLRYLSSSRVWGMNTYYDYRNTKHQHYNQISLGFESLGETWDFRMNGYLPVGWKQSPTFHTQFYAFRENFLLIQFKRDFALKGINAEAGMHVDLDEAPLYFAGGPYYLTGVGKTTWGGEFRARAELFHRYLRLEGNVSYDHFFKWIGQAQISITIPLKKRNQAKKSDPSSSQASTTPIHRWNKGEKKDNSSHSRAFSIPFFSKRDQVQDDPSCSQAITLRTRAVERVDRNEIIPVGKQRLIKKAIDPATGQPWIFWFVNNTSHSAGTYENPFSTLFDAQQASSPNQAIYVFPGDGTTTGMANGIALKNDQLFLGASIDHLIPTTKGTVVIPPLASSLPNITNTIGTGHVVTVSNDNTVSGFYIQTTVDHTGNGIDGNNISNLLVDRNTFVTSNILTTNGISLINSSGRVLVDRNIFSGFTSNDGSDNGNGIYLELAALNRLDITGNTFMSLGGRTGAGIGGEGVLLFSGAISTLSSLGNTFISLSGGCSCIFNNGTITALSSSDNIFTGLISSAGINNNGTINTLSYSRDTFNNLNSTYGTFNSGTIGTLSSSGNTFNNLIGSFCFFNGGSITTLSSSEDTFSNLASSFGILNAGSITTLSSLENVFDCLANGSFGILNAGPIITLSSSRNLFHHISTGSFGILNNGSITTLSSLEDTFNDLNNSGTGILSNGPVTTLSFSKDTFNNLNNSSFGISNNGPAITLSSSENTFSNLNLSTGIFNQGLVSTLSSSEDTFSDLTNGSIGINNVGPVTTLFSSNDTFSTFSSGSTQSFGISYLLNTPIAASLAISNNTFFGDFNDNSFATIIQVTDGILCLELIDNRATPSTGTTAYLLSQVGPGVFNRTTGSDSSTNTGQISPVGVVNPPGSCALP